jgi:hypothetical protein
VAWQLPRKGWPMVEARSRRRATKRGLEDCRRFHPYRRLTADGRLLLVKWRVAAKRGKVKAMQEGPLKDLVTAVERTKTQNPRAGRASVSYRQEPVPSSQGPLQGSGQEHGAAIQPVRAGEPGDCEKSAAVDSWGQSVRCVRKPRGEARLRGKFTVIEVHSLRHPKNSTSSRP